MQYANVQISYDAIGNPTAIGSKTLTWTGRRLNTFVNGSNSTQYTYDIDGQRYKKTVNGADTEFYYANGLLIGQQTDGEFLTFHYNEAGSPIGLSLKNADGAESKYVYVKNLQGDITGIVNAAGTLVATYVYDAWGNLLNPDDTSAPLSIGALNPLRYRGYYFDAETGFYYLNSRYYNPEWGRFLNADGIVGANGDLMSYNLFAYCSDNPVNRIDINGDVSVAIFSVGTETIIVAICALIVLVPIISGGKQNVSLVRDVPNIIQSFQSASLISASTAVALMIYFSVQASKASSQATMDSASNTVLTSGPLKGKGNKNKSHRYYDKNGISIDVENPAGREGQIYL